MIVADYTFYDKFYAPHTHFPKLRKSYHKLPSLYSFDLEQARLEYLNICKVTPLKPFEFLGNNGNLRKRISYQGLGLSSRVSKESCYDALSLYNPQGHIDIFKTFAKSSDTLPPENREIEKLDESGFSILTSACNSFYSNIIGRFKSPFTKVRFLELKPGGMIPNHFDFPYYQGIRIHACLHSNQNVIWNVEGEEFSIPSDGHSVVNNSNESRIVLSINLSVYFDRSGNPLHDANTDLFQLIDQGLI